MTKRQKGIINNYNRSTIYSVSDAYTSPSFYKTRAEKSIQAEMNAVNGWGYKVIGFNTCQFSCAYLMQDATTGEIKIVYYTASNKKVFDYISD